MYTKVAFKRDPVCTCFNENKIVTLSQKEGKQNSILQKSAIACTEKKFALKLKNVIFRFSTIKLVRK